MNWTTPIALLLWFTLTSAQPPSLEWERLIGDVYSDLRPMICPTEDDGCVVAYVSIPPGADGWTQIVICALDSTGSVSWQSSFGEERWEEHPNITRNSQGGYLLSYQSGRVSSNFADGVVVNLGSGGNTMWTRTLRSDTVSIFPVAALESDGGSVLVVANYYTPSGAHHRGFIVSEYSINGDSIRSTWFADTPDLYRDVTCAEMAQGSVIVAGVIIDAENGQPPDFQSAWAARIVDTDSVLWSRILLGEDAADILVFDSDSLLIVADSAGGVNPSQIVLTKLDMFGIQRQTAVFGGSRTDDCRSVVSTPDTCFYVVGGGNSWSENWDMWLLHLDHSLDSMWFNTFPSPQWEESYSGRITLTTTGDLIAASVRYITVTDTLFDSDIWVVRLDTHGTPISTSDQSEFQATLGVSAYPNPFNPTTTISFDLPLTSPVTLRVFNTVGQQVAELARGTFRAGHHDVLFDGSRMPSGIYFYTLTTLEASQSGKLLLLK